MPLDSIRLEVVLPNIGSVVTCHVKGLELCPLILVVLLTTM
jgi:hypothetical protein